MAGRVALGGVKAEGSSRRWRWVALIGSVVMAACIGGISTQVPKATARRTLGAQGGPSAPQPFAVVHYGPEGKAEQDAEVTLVFNRPLRALGAGQSPTPRGLQLEPPQKGHWQWVGTHALLFAPEGGKLPGATHFQVTVPGDLAALDGSQLGGTVRFDFSTPELMLATSSPSSGATGLQPANDVELDFSLPVDPKEVAQRLAVRVITDGKARPASVKVTAAAADEPKRVKVHFAEAWPPHSKVSLRIAAGLSSTEGPLPLAQDASVDFQTYEPLRITELSCSGAGSGDNRCEATSGLWVVFNNPVTHAEVARSMTLNGKPLRWPDEDDDYTSVNWWVDQRLPPGSTISLKVAGDVKDVYGQRLGQPFARRFEVKDLDPDVEVGISGDVLRPSVERTVPIGALNVSQFELLTASLDQDQFLALRRIEDAAERWKALAALKGARRRTIQSAAAKNHAFMSKVDVAEALGKSDGLLALGVNWQGDGQAHPEVHLAQVTDLGMTAKLSDGASLAWVTRLSTGKPVAGATVTVLRDGKRLEQWTADASGVLHITPRQWPGVFGNSGNAELLLLQAEGQSLVRPVDDLVPEWRLPVRADYSGWENGRTLLFTDRGIYRPGETLHVEGVARQLTPSGSRSPEGLPITVKVQGSDNDALPSVVVKADAHGAFHAQWRLPKAAKLGRWNVSATGEGGISGWTEFDLAEFRAAEFQVKVEPKAPTAMPGSKMPFTVRGDFLYGAPMAGASHQYRVTREETDYTPPGGEDYVWQSGALDEADSSMGYSELSSGSGKLGADGTAQIVQALELPGQKRAERITLEDEVTDATRQTVASSSSVLVHPSSVYVGIRSLDSLFVSAPGKVVPRLKLVDPEGKPVVGTPITVTLLHHHWSSVRQQDGDQTRVVNGYVDEVVSSCTARSTNTEASCELTTSKPGYYLIVAEARDSAGRRARSAVSLYGLGEGEVTWLDNDERTVDLSLDRKLYRVGQTARVLVKMPFPEAEALITVEAGEVLRSERRVLRGSMPVLEVPILPTMRPNAFISVHLLRGAAKSTKGKPPAPPEYRLGYAEIPVDMADRRLSVDVKPEHAEARPGDEVSVSLRVSDSAGKGHPAHLSVWAVDEGALMLTGYKTPDPLSVFAAPRALKVGLLESREAMASLGLERILSALGGNKGDGQWGGGGYEAGGPARKDFRATVFFEPTLATDDQGNARLSFKLPDSLTRYRVMAVATTPGDQFGKGEGAIVTRKPLMARPALPRLLRAGDKWSGGIVLSSTLDVPTDVTVTAQAEGLTLSGPSSKQVRVGPGASVPVPFDWSAEKVGAAVLRFSVSGAGEQDRVELSRQVASPLPLEVVSLSGEAKEPVAEALGDLSGARRDVGGLEVSVSQSALVGIEAAFEQLHSYPWYCTEQLSSRLLPVVATSSLAKSFGVETPAVGDTKTADLISQIVSRQRSSGGFVLWNDSYTELPWVSAYATWVLSEAKRRGEPVAEDVLARASQYLSGLVNEQQATELDWVYGVFALDVLAGLGHAQRADLDRWFEARERLPLFGRALLLHALWASEGTQVRARSLQRELENAIHLDGEIARVSENVGDKYLVVFDSPVRTNAIVLRALLASPQRSPLEAPLARGLLRDRGPNGWPSTQDTAFALVALDDFRTKVEVTEGAVQAKIWLGDTLKWTVPLSTRGALSAEQRLSAAEFPSISGRKLIFDPQSQGHLYYRVRLSYAPQALPAESLEAGFHVQSTLQRFTPDQKSASVPELSLSAVDAGDILQGDVVVVCPKPQRYVVLEVPLPAGLEAIDRNLATTASWLNPWVDENQDEETRMHQRAAGRGYSYASSRMETRDDRVAFFIDEMPAGIYRFSYLARATSQGQFVVPPAHAEAMYVPEVRGRTAAGHLQVR